jgi:hypothetical protein
MRTMILAGTVAAMALGAGPVLAQNMQGPGAVNYGAGSSPQTGGTSNTQANPQTSPAQRGTQGLYNYDNSQSGTGGGAGNNNNGNGRRQ